MYSSLIQILTSIFQPYQYYKNSSLLLWIQVNLILRKKMCRYIVLLFLTSTFNVKSHDVKDLPYNDSKAIFDFVKQILKNNNDITILEAGSYDGTDTLEMHKIWPNAQIHSFEPIPTLFNRLVNNVRGIKNIHCYSSALSDKTGTAEIYLSEDTWGRVTGSSSLLPPKEHLIYSPGALFNKKIPVNTITINDWAISNNIHKVNFMWLDMQGYELPVLMQSQNILATVEVIVTEVEFVEAYAGQYLFKDIKNWLEEQGFVLAAKNFDSEKKYWFGDAIFVRKNIGFNNDN